MALCTKHKSNPDFLQKISQPNYWRIYLFSLHGKVHAEFLEKIYRDIIKPKPVDTQCAFCPGLSIADQIFTLQQTFEKSWKYAKEIYICFVDLEKADAWVPPSPLRQASREKLWRVYRPY